MALNAGGSKSAVLNFDQVTEQGIRPLTTALTRNGLVISNVSATNRATRKDGIQTKLATLALSDGQELAFQVNDTGDISSIKLNGKVIPVHSTDTLAQIAQSAARTATNNSKKFTDALAKKAQRAVVADQNRKKPAVKSIAQQIQEAKAKLETSRGQATSLKAQTETVLKSANTVMSQIAKAQSQLTTEQSKGAQLAEQLRQLEKQPNA